jgi:FkbM family methyltransferase
MIALIGAQEQHVPILDPELFAPTIALMLKNHVVKDQVHDSDFWFFRDLTRHDVFCDIGANLGLSVLSLAATGAAPIVHSFEINPALFKSLRDSVADYANTWQLHEYGLSDGEGEAWIYIVKVDDIYILGEATLRLAFLQETDSITRLSSYGSIGRILVGKLRVQTRKFDDINLSPNYMKIDAEGAEALVVAGMRQTLARFKPVLMVENGAMSEVDDVLFPLGFKAFSYNVEAHNLFTRRPSGGQNTFYVHKELVPTLTKEGKIVT